MTLRHRACVVVAAMLGWIAAHAVEPATDLEPLATKTLSGLGALDVDGNGATDALTDGILLMRYMFGVRGDALVRGAVGAGATRTTPAQIEAYLSTLAVTGALTVAPGACEARLLPVPVPAIKDTVLPAPITVYCATGDAPTQCAWDQGIADTSCSIVYLPVSDSITLTVVASNAGGSSQPVSVVVRSIDYTPAPNFCYAGDSITTRSWPSSGAMTFTTSDFSTQTIAVKITVPQNAASLSDSTGTLRVAYAIAAPVVARDVTVSRNACDFFSGDYLFNAIGQADAVIGARFTVNNPTGYPLTGADFNINSGDTLYINLRNTTAGVSTCATPPCNATVEWTPPAAQ